MKPFSTFHSHPQSLDSGSTPEDMARREVELGTGSLTCTDHGTVGIARQIYDLAKKYKLTPILGLEGYMRDDDDPILLAGGIAKNEDGKLDDYAKYFHITTHALSQTAFERMVRVLTRADLEKGEQHGSERKPIFNWADLEEMLQSDMTVGSGCLVGMVQKHLMNGRKDLAVKYYERLRGIVQPGCFYVEVFPHRCDKFWDKAIYIKTRSDEGEDVEERFHFGKRLRVIIDGETKELQAFEVAKLKLGGIMLAGVKHYSTWTDRQPAAIIGIREVEDFIKNECTVFSPDGDIQKSANRFMIAMAYKYGDPIVISDDSHFARPEDKVVQDLRLLSGESHKTKGSAPAWRFYGSYHRQSSEEAFEYFRSAIGVPKSMFEKWVENSIAWRDRFGWKFVDQKQLPTKFYPSDSLDHTMKLIREVGRMDWSNTTMKTRLAAEIKMLHKNGVADLLPYFFVGQEATALYEKLGKLTGPGRGSAAGLLLAYLLGITHVNPLKYNLSKERFLTESRIKSGKWPDIDMDFGGGVGRDPLLEWLKTRFGDHCAQISTDSKMRLKTTIQDVHRMSEGQVPSEVWAVTNKLPNPPQGISDHDLVFGYKTPEGEPVKGLIETDTTLKKYIAGHQTQWDLVSKALGLVRQKGRHASAFVIMNEPISNKIPMTLVGGVPVTSYTMNAVEAAGGIKMDFLGINSLNDIEMALKLIRERRLVPTEDRNLDGVRVPGLRLVPDPKSVDKLFDVWDLPEDSGVFNDICSSKTNASIFQFGTDAAKQWLKEFVHRGVSTIKSIEDLAAFTALDRPGGLDSFVETEEGVKRNMLQEFAARAAGQPACKGRLTILDELCPETYGVLTYQEQIQKVFVAIGGTTPEEGDEFRVHVSKKKVELVLKDRAIFMPGAIKRLGQEDAERLWGMLETFANYGFNKSHAICYTVIGYACAWLQHHYPLEWWTAVLSNADRNEVNQTFWAHCGHLVDPPDVKLSGMDFEIQKDGWNTERIRAPMRMLAGVGPKAHEELVAGKPYTDLTDFLKRIKDRKAEKGRSALGTAVIQKLVIAGCMDSFFSGGLTIYEKLLELSKVQGNVDDFRYAKTGLPRVEPVGERYKNLAPLQMYLLRKSILSSYEEDILSYVEALRPGWKRASVVSGEALKEILGAERDKYDDAHEVCVVAYISGTKPFWQNKALKVTFEVDKERFTLSLWPKKRYDDDGKKLEPLPASLPPGAEGGASILTVSRWRSDQDYSIEGIEVLAAPFQFCEKPAVP